MVPEDPRAKDLPKIELGEPLEDKIYIRKEDIEGINTWYWLKGENGAWEGPKEDWNTHHRLKILPLIKKFDYVLQAGGCQGMYPKLYSRIFSQVITFEPDYLNFRVLSLNCPEENIIKIQGCLGVNRKFCSISRKTMDNTGMHTIQPNEAGNIPMFRIDDIEYPTLDLIHLDVECMEADVLLGAMTTINMHKPIVVVENPTPHVTSLLGSNGYEFREKTGYDGIFTPK